MRTGQWLMLLVLGMPWVSFGQQFEDSTDADAERLRMIRSIDRRLSDYWRQTDLQPAQASSDAEFFRRLSLDLTGTIPRVAEVRAFLSDQRPDKRPRTIDSLLSSPRHSTHLANTWRNILLPDGGGGQQLQNIVGVQQWLRRQFASNLRYDRLVADLLVARGGGDRGPALFYTVNELAPEKLAAATSRIFLGLQIDCAQCHQHPVDHWTQEDFWGYAAFFARLRQTGNVRGVVQLEDASSGEVTIPETDTVVLPTYPGGQPARVGPGGNRRVQLAIWISSRDNPYLAKATVNRVWSQLFGYGLVEPVDDMGKNNPASHPEVLEELAEYFVATGFDMRELYRTLTRTRAYQLSSRQRGPAPPSQSFARMAIKPMNAEQLYDSLLRLQSPARGLQSAGGFDARRQAFIGRYGQTRHATDYEVGVPQALTLMNGADTREATAATADGILRAIDAPFLDRDDRIRILFLATLSRPPRESELDAARRTLNEAKDKKQGYGDILWALMNSAEFVMNH